jgi:putative effector of murein hydrolase
MSNDAELTTWLSTFPLVWLTATLCVWLASERIAIAAGRHAFANPLLISIIAIATLLRATGTSYATYFSGAQFIQFLIGPAVVAIAVPLFRNWSIIKQNLVPILAALLVGCITAIVASVLMAHALGLPDIVTMSLAPKSVATGAAGAAPKRMPVVADNRLIPGLRGPGALHPASRTGSWPAQT